MPREITTHKVNALNNALTILDLAETKSDQSHSSGRYSIRPPWKNPVERYPAENSRMSPAACDITFHTGSVEEIGVTGVSIEALLAVVADRLEVLQGGNFPCRENACALTKVQEAMMWLRWRTTGRENRGVEGKQEK